MEIFNVIRKDHEKQRLLLKILLETVGDSTGRKDYFAELKSELANHAVAEERYLYVPLIDSDKTIEATRHAIAEHHQIDKLIEKLESTDMSSPAWLMHMKSLNDKVLHHLREEEEEFFPQANDVLSMRQKKELAIDYEKEMKLLSA